MSTQIIELSSFNSKEKNQYNSQYTNNFSSVVVNSGDMVRMKSAFIDTDQSGAFGNINIDDDTDLTLKFGFYVNYIAEFGVEPFNTSDGSPAPAYEVNGEPHINRESTTPYNLVTSEKTITIKAGSYSPSILGELISSSLSVVNDKSFNDFSTNPNEFLKLSAGGSSILCDNIPITTSGQDIGTFTSKTIPLPAEIVTEFPVSTEVTIDYEIFASDTPPQLKSFKTIIQTIDGATGVITVLPEFKYIYTPASGAYMGKIEIKRTTPVPNSDSARFYSQSDNTKYVTIGNAIKNPDGGIIKSATDKLYGASRVSLVYNQDDKRFAWEYIHSPYYTTSNDVSSESVGFDSKQYTVDSIGGIFFTELEPQSFWSDVLGMDLTTIIPDVSFDVGSVTLIRQKSITSNYMAITDTFDHANNMDVPTSKAVFSVSNNTQQIKAIKDYQSNNITGGYYLISIDGLYTNYKEDTQEKHNISAIVSRQYNENGFISDWGLGSLNYLNTGEAFNLGSLQVSILNPVTKEVVKGLGQNTSVFIEVIHNEEVQEENEKTNKK